ncbi:YidC/Oxa1 family membrane protein insertase [Dyella japonica]|uniref:Membrane protein insertase YidC n=1 Tax=Dyella japonica TaxID=231455 RepID=A0ABV2K1D2_9GAMM
MVTLSTDLLRLTVDTRSGNVVRSELLKYPLVPWTKKDSDPTPVRLLSDERADYFVAQSGLVSTQGNAPHHRAMFHASRTSYALAQNQDELKVDLNWAGADGLRVTKTYVLRRGSYVVNVNQKIDNDGSVAWQGNACEQLQRAAPTQQKTWWQNFSDPASHSFYGAAWYSPEDKLTTLPFADFQKNPLNHTITGGWASMLQHYFFVAWIPSVQDANVYSTSVINPEAAQPTYLIRAILRSMWRLARASSLRRAYTWVRNCRERWNKWRRVSILPPTTAGSRSWRSRCTGYCRSCTQSAATGAWRLSCLCCC